MLRVAKDSEFFLEKHTLENKYVITLHTHTIAIKTPTHKKLQQGVLKNDGNFKKGHSFKLFSCSSLFPLYSI